MLKSGVRMGMGWFNNPYIPGMQMDDIKCGWSNAEAVIECRSRSL